MKYEEARNEANRLVRKAMYEYERSTAINMKKDSFIFIAECLCIASILSELRFL
jgi:hypothetical protein